MFCKNCGSDANENMKFCNNCGSEISSAPEEGLYMPQQTPSQNTVMPQQQNVAQPQNVPPMNSQYAQPPVAQPGYYPPPQKKGSNTGLIITAIAIAMVVLIGGVLLFAFRDSIFGGAAPTPSNTPSGGGVVVNPGNPDRPQPGNTDTPPPAPGNTARLGEELEGSWGNGSGDWIYYFHEAANIRFTLTGDGEGRVYEDEWGEWGNWWIDSDGYLHIIGDFDGEYDIFTYVVRGDTLTIYDEDRDSRIYTR